MHLPESLLALLLLCMPPASSESQWPHNVPKHQKYFPEDEVHVKRGLSIQERLQREKPIGVKKMSDDEGEMFFLDNWIFAGDEERSEGANASMPASSPLRPHAERNLFDPFRRFAPRASLFARDYQCPTGTKACSSIGAPDSCCASESTCIPIQDNGYGSVGCCPAGQTCSGGIFCDESQGYSSCPDSPNGGCCLPGYSCQDVGCVIAGTSVTFVQPPTSSASRSSSTAVIVVPTSPSSATPTSTSTSTSTPTSSTSYSCTTGWFSCPASLGGGCCQNGRQCATGASCLGTESGTTSTQAPSAPVRPTSNSVVTSSAPSSSGTGPEVCPSGFYVCSAYYPSGCCRVGRDCQTTGTCIQTASETVVNSNGVVIVAPTGSAPQGGSCPSAWFSCAASEGGNCCPNGYSCGNQCTATSSSAGSIQVTNKVAPSAPSTGSSFSYTSISLMISAAMAIGTAMIVL